MAKLGSLYRKYLRGADLGGQVLTVRILECSQVVVHPPPTYTPVEKYALRVAGLPADLPEMIILGPNAEKQLVKIFGQVDTSQLVGKHIDLVPSSANIGGSQKIMITFRKAQPNQKSQHASVEDVVQFTDDDDVPF